MLKSLSALTTVLIPMFITCIANTSHARFNTITGGVVTAYDYTKTDFEIDNIDALIQNRDTTEQELSIGPLFIFKTTSGSDGLTISINPTFVYDIEDSGQNDINHNFSLTAFSDLTRLWRIDLSETFITSNDPELLNAETISDYNKGRRRYWENNINVGTVYTYDIQSSFGAGYTYRILRNDDTGPGGYEDYDRHVVDLTLQHRINPKWNFSLFTNYTRGLFDPPEPVLLEEVDPAIINNINADELSNDLSEYKFGGAVNWVLSTRQTFLLGYDFTASNYDAPLRFDTNLHNLTFGAQYQHTRRLFFELGVGPSYEKTETFDPRWGYNGILNLSYDLAAKSSISAGIEKGYNQSNFSTNNNLRGRDQGLTDFWNFNVDLTYQLTTALTTSVSGAYREEKQENLLVGVGNTITAGGNPALTDREALRDISVFKRKIYRGGASLDYIFLRWYTASINYTYRDQDSEFPNDSYDEHRVFLTLTFKKELFRW